MEKFYGQFDPPLDKFIFERYFPNKDTLGVFIECGAFDGLTENSCKFFEETMNWKGYNIEPVPWIYERLCKNRPESKNFNFALSNENGEATFKAVDHPTFGVDCTNGSLNHTQAHSSLLKEIGCQIVETKVQVKTWPDFISQENITYIDLLVLDVEGHELSVIEGMRGSTVLPDIICIEVGHLCFDDIRRELHRIGYTYDISSHVNAFFIKNDKLPIFCMRRSDYILQKTISLNDIENGFNDIKNRLSDLSLSIEKFKNEQASIFFTPKEDN
ncbi:TPA: FkbM family methyltransferase, partial [Aeromonas hydrophila]|nr:FkbM family methyltransferase [Aeromonas hydrophila]